MNASSEPMDHVPALACHECGLIQRVPPQSGGSAKCVDCGAVLRRMRRDSIERALFQALGASILFVVANMLPFLTFKFEGREQVAHLVSTVLALWSDDMRLLSVLVLVVSMVVPAAKLMATLYALLPIWLGVKLPGSALALRLTERLTDWAMIDVLMLGVLVSYVKMADLAPLVVGPGVLALVGCLLMMTAADAVLDRQEAWEHHGPQATLASLAAAGPGVPVSCHDCDQLVVLAPDHARHASCPRCGAALHRRKVDSLARTWAFLVAAAALYVPANLLPVMTIISFGRGDPSTIIGGVILLLQLHMYPVAAVVFIASILVPVLKLMGLVYLLVSIHRGWDDRLLDRTRMFRLIELVGRWSMVDVFVVAILVALVALGSLATIVPGLGMVAFGGTVVMTMLASSSLDPRLMWDRRSDEHAARA